MLEKEILDLLKLLSEDDNFASDFEKSKSIGEKYDLAKSKFATLQKDDFIKFMLEFQAEQSELNDKDLSEVSGGVSKRSLVTKLTALAMLATTFGAISSVGISSAQGLEPFAETDIADFRKNHTYTSDGIKALEDSKDLTSQYSAEIARVLYSGREAIHRIIEKSTLAKIKSRNEEILGIKIGCKNEANNDVYISKSAAEHIILGDWKANVGVSWEKVWCIH